MAGRLVAVRVRIVLGAAHRPRRCDRMRWRIELRIAAAAAAAIHAGRRLRLRVPPARPDGRAGHAAASIMATAVIIVPAIVALDVRVDGDPGGALAARAGRRRR